MLLRLVVVTSLLQCVASYAMYQRSIPNGESVPSPCKTGQLWHGVGHFLDVGTGVRNPFGADFEAAGKTWTKALCLKDSDGDGRTNGVELGDPGCVWIPGTSPNTTLGLSHPGICEPVTSSACQQKKVTWGKYSTQQEWLAQVCKTEGFQCPALDEQDVANVTVRIPPGTRIPGQETTYECQIFDLAALGVRTEDTFHMVAVTPLIDNDNVLHHMVLVGCTDNVVPSSGPYHCGMLASDSCMQFLHVWTKGLDGECYHAQSGVKIGRGGIKYVAVQLHWNNPEMKTNLTDSSGMVLHYTPHLRQYDSGVLIVGSNMFHLPPKKDSVTVHSKCSNECTQRGMVGPIHVTFAWSHMHYAGRKMSISLVRNGAHITYLTNDQNYAYDNPEVNLYPDPVILQPGDELTTTCQFNTLNRNRTIFYGESTQDEMCYGYLTYFPLENYTQPFCTDDMEISFCDPASYGQCTNPDLLMSQLTNSTVYREVIQNCKYFTPCLDECVDTLVKYFKTEPCMKGKIWEFIQYHLAGSNAPQNQYFLGSIASCKSEVYLALNPTPKDNSNQGITAATGSLPAIVLTLAIVWMYC